MFYLDTSVLIAALTPEPASEAVLDWLAAQEAGSLSISGWVSTEVSSALAMKVRTKALTLAKRAQVLTAYHRLVEESLTVEPVSVRHFETAARFVDQHDLGMRAGDALHLAIASERGLTLATLDRRLADVGPKLGAATLFMETVHEQRQ